MYSLYGGVYDKGCSCAPTFSAFSKEYWERSLFQRLRTIFEFGGFPEGGAGQVRWDKDAFLYGLFRLGFLVVFETKQYGIVPPQPATPYGFGLQHQPVGMNIATPYFMFARPLEIGRECEVIKLTPDYRGVWDIIEKYASEMQYTEVAIRLAQINARFTYAIAAENDKDKQSIDAMMEKLANAEPAITYNVNLMKQIGKSGERVVPWQQFDRDLKQNFILPELLEARRTILSDFYKEIGIRIAPEKKERLIQTEVETSDSETYNRRMVWDISLQESLDKVNRMYGTKIWARFTEPEMRCNDITKSNNESAKS